MISKYIFHDCYLLLDTQYVFHIRFEIANSFRSDLQYYLQTGENCIVTLNYQSETYYPNLKCWTKDEHKGGVNGKIVVIKEHHKASKDSQIGQYCVS